MPETINGIGTWYCGRDNVHTHAGACEFCGSYGLLASYDTTLFFTLAYLPLIPLGKRHVIDECPSCRKHRVLSLKAWEELRERTLTETFAAYRGDLRDEKKAIDALLATTSFRHQEAFERVAPIVQENLSHNAEVNNVLAAAHDFFGDARGAAVAYRRSLELKPDPDVARALAIALLRLGKPDEAAPLLAPIVKERDARHVGLLYLLVEAYQAEGRHNDALHLLDDLVAAFPSLANDKQVRRYRKASEKRRESGTPIASRSLRVVVSGAAVRKSRFAALPMLVAPVLVLAALGVFAVVSFSEARSRPVYVVNGLSRDYDVEVNGVRHTLPARGSRRVVVNVKEGDVRVRVPDESLRMPEQVCHVATSFWSRPFGEEHFVINPDRAAILYVETTHYSANPDYDRENPVTFRTGRLLYDFSDVDFLFTEFPETLRLQGNKAVSKSRLGLHPVEPVDQAFYVLLQNAGKEAAGEYARRQLDAAPERTELLPYLSYALVPEDALAYLRPRLARRPISVGWHRQYQDLMEAHHSEHDLYAEYRALRERDGKDPSLAYLLGCVATDRAEARKLFEQAANAAPPVARALNALAYDALSDADFRAALGYARRALALSPEDESFRVCETEALLGLGQYEPLIEQAERARRERPLDLAAAKLEAHHRACKGDVAGARRVVDEYLGALPVQLGPQVRQQLRDSLEAAIAYASGDASKYAAIPRERAMPADRYVAAVCAGRFEDAVAALDEAGLEISSAAIDPYLTLHLAAATRGQSQLARQYLDLAVKSMRKDDADMRKLADHLTASARPAPEDVAPILMFPNRKRLALAAMALRFPADRGRYAALARPYNYDRHFPYLLVRRVHDGR